MDIMVSRVLYQLPSLTNKEELILCLDNVLRKTIIAGTVTPSFPLLGLLQLCKMKGCLLSSSRAPAIHLLPRKRQTRYSYLGPSGPNISYSHVQLSNDLIGPEAPGFRTLLQTSTYTLHRCIPHSAVTRLLTATALIVLLSFVCCF